MAFEISAGNSPDKRLCPTCNVARDLAFLTSDVIGPSILFHLISILSKCGNPQIPVGMVPERELLLTLKSSRVEQLALTGWNFTGEIVAEHVKHTLCTLLAHIWRNLAGKEIHGQVNDI